MLSRRVVVGSTASSKIEDHSKSRKPWAIEKPTIPDGNSLRESAIVKAGPGRLSFFTAS
jgi:hypothetical protein